MSETQVQACPERELGLALDQLCSGEPGSKEQLWARLEAIQQACASLAALVERGGRLSTDLLENALAAVCRALGGVRTQLEATASQLEAVRAVAWCQAALAAADTCLHSEVWHAAFVGDVGAGGKQAYLRSTALARDMLRNEVLPLLAAAAAQQTSDTGFCLAAQFQAVLAMGRTAAEVVGMRDPRHRLEGLRNFSVLNVLWNGIQKLWCAVPADVRSDLDHQGLGAAALAQLVLGFMRKDVRTCHQLLEPGMDKLLLYWLQKAKFVLGDYNTAASSCWQPLLDTAVCAQREVAMLLGVAAGGGAPASAVALADALRGMVVPRVVALLASCLSWTSGEDSLRVMLDALRMKLTGSSGGDGAAGAAPNILHVVLQLLHAAPTMSVPARNQCVSLLGSVLEALPGPVCTPALGCSELREQVAEAVLAFLAACCHAAATAPGNADAQEWERHMAAQTWERCQQQLFLHALQPHPLTAHVLGSVWSDLAALASAELLQSHVSVLSDLLHLAAATEAAGGQHVSPSALYMQLLGLLACVLAAAPPPMLEAYYANFLQVLPAAREDVCHLACVAAELRVATVVDMACGRPAGAKQAEDVLRSLYEALHEAGPLVMKQLPPSDAADEEGTHEEGCAYLAWLLDAVQCAVAYLVGTSAKPTAACADLLAALPPRLTMLLSRAVERGVLSFASPLLAALRDLQALAPLEPRDLQQLLQPLATCLGRPALAGTAAQLVPALAQCGAPHAEVVQLAAAASSPLLQHLGMEAFRLYARACPPEHVALAVPPMARNPESGLPVDSFAALLQQYLQRSPAGGAGLPPEEEVASWVPALRQDALSAAAALRRALEAHRMAAERAAAAAANDGSGAPADQDDGMPLQCAGDGGGVAEDPVAAAAQQVARAVEQVDAALAGAELHAAAVLTLQQCAARLAHLLQGAAGVEA